MRDRFNDQVVLVGSSRDITMEKSLQEESGESWLQRMQKRREQVPACLQSVNPLDGGCIFVTLGTNSRITLDLHELDGYTTYQVLRNPMVSSQVRTDGSRLLFGGGFSLSVGELFWLLMKGPQGSWVLCTGTTKTFSFLFIVVAGL